jgi:hypothetical protein
MRLSLAAILFIAAASVAVAVSLPPTWQMWLQTEVAGTASAIAAVQIGPVSLFAVLTVVLLCALGLILLLKPVRPAFYEPYQLATNVEIAPAESAPVSIYLDLENQSAVAGVVDQFAQLIRERIGGRRADLFLYADLLNFGYAQQAQRLHEIGFQAISVSHSLPGLANLPNMVDLKLSRDVYQRAITGPKEQHIILIAGDTDYLELCYALRVLGHRVTVWAYAPPKQFLILRKRIGLGVLNLEDVLFQKRQNQTAKQQNQTVRETTPPQEPGRAVRPVTLDTLREAMKVTLDLHMADPKVFRSRMGSVKNDILSRLGYRGGKENVGGTRIDAWLQHVTAVGITLDATPQSRPTSSDIEAASERMYRLLQEIAREATQRAQHSGNPVVALSEICEHVGSKGTTGTTLPDEFAAMRALLHPPTQQSSRNQMRYLCHCARALGLIQFDEDAAMPDAIRVRLPMSGAETSARP